MVTIAVPDLSNARWTAGGSYSEVMARILGGAAMRRNEPHILHFSAARTIDAPGVDSSLLPPVDPLPGERALLRLARRGPRTSALAREGTIRRRLGVRDGSDALSVAARSGADAVFPTFVRPPATNRTRYIAWIGDLQDRRMPELFDASTLQKRDAAYRSLGERCASVVVSSHAVAADVAEFYPQFSPKVRVVSFPSLLAVRDALPAVAPTSELYHLPERYFLCANQVWVHKNHAVVVDAARLLREAGTPVTIVMTGLPLDSRSASNTPTSDLLGRIGLAGVGADVLFLGLVPSDHLVSLMRGAAAVIQPSKSEGWNTTVQDAKALGVPTICSNLDVHLEQAPDSIGFFDPDDPAALAALLASAPAADPERDVDAAIEHERAFARGQGDLLWDVCAGTGLGAPAP